jgi:hypothetical protein
VDLTTGEKLPTPGARTSERIVDALKRASQGPSEPVTLPIVTRYHSPPLPEPCVCLDGNSIRVVDKDAASPSFEPQRDGKPLLGGADIARAQLAGDVLALALRRGKERSLVFFHGPDGRVIGELPHPHSYSPFALSRDGGLVAAVNPSKAVVVCRTGGSHAPLATAAPAGLHNNLEVRLEADPFRLHVRVGAFAHTLGVHKGELQHVVVTGAARHPPLPPKARPAGARESYDPARFPPGEAAGAGRLTAVVDRLGQVVLNSAGRGVVAAVVVRRELIAVWAPGDVFWGSTALIGGPPTPHATRTIAMAITAAGGPLP